MRTISSSVEANDGFKSPEERIHRPGDGKRSCPCPIQSQIKTIKLKTLCSIKLAEKKMAAEQSWLNCMMADLELEFAAAWTGEEDEGGEVDISGGSGGGSGGAGGEGRRGDTGNVPTGPATGFAANDAARTRDDDVVESGEGGEGLNTTGRKSGVGREQRIESAAKIAARTQIEDGNVDGEGGEGGNTIGR